MILGNTVYTIWKGIRYRLYLEGECADLYSIDKERYKDIIGLKRDEIENAFRTIVWVNARGCKAIYAGKKGSKIKLNVKPSDDVITLNAVEIDRGVFEAEIPISEVEQIWEERNPYLNFQYPNNFDRIQSLNIDDLNA
ncbi:MAG TPA: hypothetical protein VK177_09690 [Flavobacteriales bacterium]|nr:hypothetical protein [Flavobacteriales bacterium]